MATTFDASDPIIIPATTEQAFTKLFPTNISIDIGENNKFILHILLKRYNPNSQIFMDDVLHPMKNMVQKRVEITAAELGQLIDWLRNKITT